MKDYNEAVEHLKRSSSTRDLRTSMAQLLSRASRESLEPLLHGLQGMEDGADVLQLVIKVLPNPQENAR